MNTLHVVTDAPDVVLIVDDEPTIRMMLTRMVQAAGPYEPIAVSTAAEGYRRLTELGSRVALLLLDLSMDDMDGFAFRDLQLAGPAADVPTVILSGRVLGSEELARLRPAAALLKPATFAVFRECLLTHARVLVHAEAVYRR